MKKNKTLVIASLVLMVGIIMMLGTSYSLITNTLVTDEGYRFDVESFNVEFLDNFKFIKGDNTWTVGNIFSLYWVGVTNIEFICISTTVTRMKKKIKWKCKCDIGINYYKTMILYIITYDDKTLVKFNFTRCENNKLVDFQPNYYLELQYNILKSQSEHIQNLKREKTI